MAGRLNGQSQSSRSACGALFDAHRHKTIATLRADGSPRISGIEAAFENGDLIFASMPNARKGVDLHRDPRFALHSATVDPVRAPRAVAGRGEDLRSGRRRRPGHRRIRRGPVPCRYRRRRPSHLNAKASMLVVEWWTPTHGLQRIERNELLLLIGRAPMQEPRVHGPVATEQESVGVRETPYSHRVVAFSVASDNHVHDTPLRATPWRGRATKSLRRPPQALLSCSVREEHARSKSRDPIQNKSFAEIAKHSVPAEIGRPAPTVYFNAGGKRTIAARARIPLTMKSCPTNKASLLRGTRCLTDMWNSAADPRRDVAGSS